MGIRDVTLKQFASTLSNRKQAVFCNYNISTLKSIIKGVPQGSILEPLLFWIYTNDISNASDNFSYFLFAEETNLLLIKR